MRWPSLDLGHGTPGDSTLHPWPVRQVAVRAARRSDRRPDEERRPPRRPRRCDDLPGRVRDQTLPPSRRTCRGASAAGRDRDRIATLSRCYRRTIQAPSDLGIGVVCSWSPTASGRPSPPTSTPRSGSRPRSGHHRRFLIAWVFASPALPSAGSYSVNAGACLLLTAFVSAGTLRTRAARARADRCARRPIAPRMRPGRRAAADRAREIARRARPPLRAALRARRRARVSPDDRGEGRGGRRDPRAARRRRSRSCAA